jgi:hypothetical protein
VEMIVADADIMRMPENEGQKMGCEFKREA